MITEVIPKKQENPITQALLNIEGYLCILNFDPGEPNLGASGIRGVAIYYRKSLNVSEVEFQVDGLKDQVWIEIPYDNCKLLCDCVYRSPTGTDRSKCLESTAKVMQRIHIAYQRNPNLLICGDYNYKEIDWSTEYAPPTYEHLLKFIETLRDCFLFQNVTEPKRYRENEMSNILDLIITNEEGTVQDLNYHPPLGESDHLCLTFTAFELQRESPFIPTHNVFKTNYEKVREEMQQYDWYEVFNKNFVSDYEYFFNILHSALTKHSPMSTLPKRRTNIYLTNEAIRLKNAKNRAWKRYLSTRTNYDRVSYIRLKNTLRNLTRNLRSSFEMKMANDVKLKPKLFWKYARSQLKSRQAIPTLTNKDGTKAISAKDKAESLNDFFTSVFTTENLGNIPAVKNAPAYEVLSNIEITLDLARTKLNALNPNKSPGQDKWHPYFLKELSETICTPLSILFTKSLKEVAHESWRKAVITAIYKKGMKSLTENYRPISIRCIKTYGIHC